MVVTIFTRKSEINTVKVQATSERNGTTASPFLGFFSAAD
jgi:hypothetical protein